MADGFTISKASGDLVSMTMHRGPFDNLVSKVSRTLAQPTRILDRIGRIAVRSVEKTIKAGGRPKPWKESIRARETGRPTLNDKGALLGSIFSEVSGSKLIVASDSLKARILHFGGTIKPVRAKALRFKLADGSWVTTKQVTIPARPFMVLQVKDYNTIRSAIKDEIGKL